MSHNSVAIKLLTYLIPGLDTLTVVIAAHPSSDVGKHHSANSWQMRYNHFVLQGNMQQIPDINIIVAGWTKNQQFI